MIEKKSLGVFLLLLATMFPLFAVNPIDVNLLPDDKKVGKRVVSFSGKIKGKRSSGTVSRVAEFGGRDKRPNGIEGRKLTFGFHVGAAIPLLETAKTEAMSFGGKFNFSIYGLIPHTKTFAIGADIGGAYLLVSQSKYITNLSSTQRDRTSAATEEPEVSVNNWFLATPQVSFMGNFHPKQRFNIQLKGNIGLAMIMVPQTSAQYYLKDIQADGTYQSKCYEYAYRSGMQLGFCGALGTDLLYALSNHVELKGGLDLTYIRFSYSKEWIQPIERVTKVVSHLAMLDIHIGFAFNF